MKIKANEKLFNDWDILGLNIRNQKAIVQNDTEISARDYGEFLTLCNQYHRRLEDLMARTQLWIEYNQEVKDA